MKVILLNGSRREKGCTYTALSVVADTLKENGIDAEIVHAVPTMLLSTLSLKKCRPLTAWSSARRYTGLRRLVKSSLSWISWLAKPALP